MHFSMVLVVAIFSTALMGCEASARHANFNLSRAGDRCALEPNLNACQACAARFGWQPPVSTRWCKHNGNYRWCREV